MRRIEEQINELQGWLAEEKALLETETATPPTPQTAQPIPQTQQPIQPLQPAQPKQPTFAKTILDIITRQAQGRPTTQDDANLFSFLAHNKINDYEGLENHLTNLMEQQRELGHEYNPIRKRLAVLDEHLRRHEDYKKWRAEYQQYQKDLANQMPWRKKSFAADNSHIVDRYNKAKEYIDGVRNADGKIPLPTWQREHSELSEKVRKLDGRYQTLKNKVAQADKFRVRLYDVIRKEQRQYLQQTQPTKRRAQDWDR